MVAITMSMPTRSLARSSSGVLPVRSAGRRRTPRFWKARRAGLGVDEGRVMAVMFC